MNIAERLLANGQDQAIAMVCGNTATTYRELRQDSLAVARFLLARGHTKGDRVGIWSENNPFFVAVYLGTMRAGLVAVPLQTELPESSFAAIVAHAGITDLFVSKRFANRLLPWAAKAGVKVLVESDWRCATAGTTQPMPDIDPRRDLAALMFTSGSTGAPKGVMVSHRNLACNTADIVGYLGLSAADRALVVLPFHYCFGASLLHTHLMAGGSVVLNNTFMYPETVVQEMLATECTGLAGVPSTYQILLRKSRFRETKFPKLRWFQQAGGKLPNPHIVEILAAFPDVSYFLMYGQTEATARLSYLPPERLGDKLGSIGRGLPSTRLEVLDPTGAPVRPASDETGEIVATGDNVALGYWNDPDETAPYFRNGSLFTGDLARVDSDGFIFIVERERDMIKAGGNRVSAQEVEDAIAELPEVIEVAVVGTPHELLGESILAFVMRTPDAHLSSDDVQAHCRKRLPQFKVPETVRFIRSMPHNASGKVAKPKLREMALA